MKKKIIIIAAGAAVLALLTQAVYHSVKKLPPGVGVESGDYYLEDEDVKFLTDITYRSGSGDRRIEQEIFDEVFELIDGAQKYIISDMFLINDFQGKVPETYSLLSEKFSYSLIRRKKNKPDMNITVITDGINTVFGGIRSSYFSAMRKAGINVIITDSELLRDSNLVYSPFWRLFIKPFGEPEEPGGIIPNPIDNSDKGIAIRGGLRLLNFKANHRKIVAADSAQTPACIIMSGNAQDASSAHTNTGVRLKGNICAYIIENEMEIARFSGYEGPGIQIKETEDANGGIRARFITEGAIAKNMEMLIDMCGKGDSISMVMFFLSDKGITDRLIKAAKRGADVRVVLDPNKDAFGRPQNGIPNTGAAKSLVDGSDGAVKIRWYDTHGEQCHVKMTLFEIGGRSFMINGSANMTRRNLRNLNLEADILLEARDAEFMNEAKSFFERIWNNKNGQYTLEYKVYKNESILNYFFYRMQEVLGTGTF
ncbi:MAG: phospholipase D-like domain-containing protein [bacterium]